MDCRRIICTRDANALRQWLEKRYRVDVGPDMAAALLDEAWEFAMERPIYYSGFQPQDLKGWRPGYTDDDTWGMYFSNRLRERGYGWLFMGRAATPPFLRLTVEMHVGFLSVEETPEQLERLRQTNKDKSFINEYEGFAASKIWRTQLAVTTPIDKTAARVAFHK